MRAERLRTWISSATRKQESRPIPNWPMKSAALLGDPLGALAAAADRGEEGVHVGLGETDAVVLDAYHRTVGVQADAEGVGGRGRFEAAPGGQRVHRVLQQFAQVDARAGVEVVGEEVDEAAQIHLEGAVGAGRVDGGVGQSHRAVRGGRGDGWRAGGTGAGRVLRHGGGGGRTASRAPRSRSMATWCRHRPAFWKTRRTVWRSPASDRAMANMLKSCCQPGRRA